MIWRKHLNEVLNVLIHTVNILSEKATNDPNATSQVFLTVF
jgi:hypothetical protein